MEPTPRSYPWDILDAHWRRIMRHRERYARAWLATTGTPVTEAVWVHQKLDGVTDSVHLTTKAALRKQYPNYVG